MSSPYGAWRTHSFDTPHIQYDFSGRVISPMQRPPPDNTQHDRQTSMPPEGFEPTIPASERQQTQALDRAATGTGPLFYSLWAAITEFISTRYILSCFVFSGDEMSRCSVVSYCVTFYFFFCLLSHRLTICSFFYPDTE